MSDDLDPAHLRLIDRAINARGWMPAIPLALRRDYQSEIEKTGHAVNRPVLALMTILFSLFWFVQRQSAPDILVASAWLRFGLYAPCAVLFLILDIAGRLRRFTEPGLLALAVAPVVITGYLCLATQEMLPQPEVYGTPLILLYTGMLLRMRPASVMINAAACTMVYAGTTLVCPMLPHTETATLIFVQLGIALAVVSFNLQLERRDRWVFLLTRNERIRRALVAAQNSSLLRQTQTDALTGLANRRCFDETLSNRWLEALETATWVGLIMIDVDHFKAYNDHYGHTVGDDCLARVAAQLTASARREDLAARYGGEEFVIIMSGAELPEMLRIAERIREAVLAMALPHGGLPHEAVVTISLGCAATIPDNGRGARNLIEAADRQLYQAKRCGRNAVSSELSLIA